MDEEKEILSKAKEYLKTQKNELKRRKKNIEESKKKWKSDFSNSSSKNVFFNNY